MSAVVIRAPRRRSGQTVDFGLAMTEELYASTYSRRHWNTIVRNGLVDGGSQWIAGDLPKRFSDFAYVLGYDAKGKKRSPLSRAIASGLVDRLAVRFWHGWNPWNTPKPPYSLWSKYLADEARMGRFVRSRTGYFTTARKELRRMVKADIKRRVLELSTSEEVNEKIPLVEFDRLRPAALSGARAVGRATTGNYQLRLVIPQPHPTHRSVSNVMKQVTPQEVARIGTTTMRSINTSIAGSTTHTVRRGRTAGQIRRRLPDASPIHRSRAASARHTSRSPATS